MNQQTFDFGYGPVLAHCHKNPDNSEGGWVAETAHVAETAYVLGNALIYGDARIFDRVRIFGNAQIHGNTRISDNAQVYGNARISGNVWIYGNARVSGNVWIYDDARIYGDAWIYSDARISGNVHISRTEQVLTIGLIGARNDILTVVFGNDGEIWCSCGRFGGSLAEFQAEVEKKLEGDKHQRKYIETIEYIKKIAKLT